MDASRFDALARSLEAGIPRRAALGGMLGAGFFSLLSRFGAGETEAKNRRKKKKKKCKGGKVKCGKKCILPTECCGGCGEQLCCDGICADCCVDADCPTGATCESGSCVCPLSTTNCGDICADLVTDGDNCGSCGNACDTGDCVNGTCTCLGVTDCPAGCGCVSRAEGGQACGGETDVPETCDDDDDCPIGAFCADFGLQNFCTGVCQA